MSYGTLTNELCHTNQWTTPQQPMSYATLTNELRHNNQWATQHQPMSYTTPTNELRHNIYIHSLFYTEETRQFVYEYMDCKLSFH